MGNTTFSGAVRVGKKPYAAGTLLAQLAVPTSDAFAGLVVATLPPGSLIQSIMSDAVGPQLTFDEVGGAGTATPAAITVIGEPVYTAAFTSDLPISVTVAVTAEPSTTYITYKPYDAASGANA